MRGPLGQRAHITWVCLGQGPGTPAPDLNCSKPEGERKPLPTLLEVLNILSTVTGQQFEMREATEGRVPEAVDWQVVVPSESPSYSQEHQEEGRE